MTKSRKGKKSFYLLSVQLPVVLIRFKNPARDKELDIAPDSSNTARPVGQRFRVTGKVTLQRLQENNLQVTGNKILQLDNLR